MTIRATVNETEYPYITVTSGMSGYFAVMVWWNPEMGGFEEPWDTGIGRYHDSKQAIQEAKAWAKDQDIDFRYGGETIKGTYK
jgi:hypothetical protein